MCVVHGYCLKNYKKSRARCDAGFESLTSRQKPKMWGDGEVKNI